MSDKWFPSAGESAYHSMPVDGWDSGLKTLKRTWESRRFTTERHMFSPQGSPFNRYRICWDWEQHPFFVVLLPSYRRHIDMSGSVKMSFNTLTSARAAQGRLSLQISTCPHVLHNRVCIPEAGLVFCIICFLIFTRLRTSLFYLKCDVQVSCRFPSTFICKATRCVVRVQWHRLRILLPAKQERVENL